jgi:hypothetical protein
MKGTGMAGYVFKLESKFARATGNRDWHATIDSPRSEPFREMELRVTARGENTNRFFPYAIKAGPHGAGLRFSYDFKDGGDVPFDGTGDEITLYCTLYYDAPK